VAEIVRPGSEVERSQGALPNTNEGKQNMGKVETVVVEKDGAKVTVNASDVANWEANGYSVAGEAPTEPPAPKPDEYRAVMREAGAWDAVLFVNGEETETVLNAEPLKKGEAAAVVEQANGELAAGDDG